jgi:hypothetical protein
MFDTVITEFLVSMDNDFRIAVRAKTVSPLSKLLLKFAIIVDFSIEDDDDTFIFVENGLVAKRYVDDREAPDADRHTIAYPDALFVRTTMANGLTHRIDEQTCVVTVTPRIDEPRYSAHLLVLPF